MYNKTLLCAGLALATALLLAACASPEQRAAYQQQQRYQAEQAQRALLAGLTAKCRQYGFQVGTTAFEKWPWLSEQHFPEF